MKASQFAAMSQSPLFSVGSQNPVKVASVAEAVRDFWQDARVVGVEVGSAVSNQPHGDGEIRMGALNRAHRALSAIPDARYGVGLEGGVVDGADGMWVYAWVAVADRSGRIGEGRTGQFLLPEPVARLIRDQGLEMGDADDRYFGRANSKQKEGAIGLLTGRKLTRQDFYRQAVVFALLPFICPQHYNKRDSHQCPSHVVSTQPESGLETPVMVEDRVYRSIRGLRAPERLAILEAERVAALSLRDRRIHKVLDIGTGSGIFAEVFAGLGLDVTGIDIQEPMLESARKLVPRAHFGLGSSEALPFADASFDLCFLGLVLHETTHPLCTLQEARRVAAGRVAVLEWPYKEQEMGPPLEHRLKTEEVLRLAAAVSFRDTRTIPLEHLVLFLLDG